MSLTVVLGLMMGLFATVPSPAASSQATQGEAIAEVQRTEYGIPHIRAQEPEDLGFGFGYVTAEDHLCALAEVFTTVRGVRASISGDPADLDSDTYHRAALGDDMVRASLEGAFGPPPTSEARALARGFAAGHNALLDELDGTEAAPSCLEQDLAAQLRIEEFDVWRRVLQLATQFGFPEAGTAIARAAPPSHDRAAGTAPLTVARPQLGSNAIALGGAATASGHGMLLANPHLSWQPDQRFTQVHLTLDGEFDVSGVAILGVPFIAIGHGSELAWTHTVSATTPATIQQLDLAEDDPTAYLVDGEQRDMDRIELSVPVRSGDEVVDHPRTVYETEFGWVFETDLLPWTDQHAYALREAATGNVRSVDTWLALARANDVQAAEAALRDLVGLPNLTTVAADVHGEVLFAAVGAVPYLSDQQQDACFIDDPGAQVQGLTGVPVLDGSDTSCAWQHDDDAVAPGTIPGGDLPLLVRQDYVVNSNQSHWLTNLDAPIEGFPTIVGDERTQRSLRTRLAIDLVERGLDGATMRLPDLQTLMFRNDHGGGMLLRDELVEACEQQPSARDDAGVEVDLREACASLAAWDLRVDLDSRGSQVFREFFARAPIGLFAEPFDPDNPLTTPRGLATDDPAVLRALAGAVRDLEERQVPLDARLGDIQSIGPDSGVSMHGAPGDEGVFNVVAAEPTIGGYRDLAYGVTHVMAIEMTADGPVNRTITAYSQSSDPASPHYTDQLPLLRDKQWISVPLTQDEILQDPELITYSVPRGPVEGGSGPPVLRVAGVSIVFLALIALLALRRRRPHAQHPTPTPSER